MHVSVVNFPECNCADVFDVFGLVSHQVLHNSVYICLCAYECRVHKHLASGITITLVSQSLAFSLAFSK